MWWIRCSSLLLSFSVIAGGSNMPCKYDSSGVNVYVDEVLNVRKQYETRLPDLPDGSPTITYGHVSSCSRFDGVITVGGTLSMGHEDAYYGYSTQLRRSVQIFLDWLNDERGGILVNGSRYAMRFRWVDDASSKQQVTKAMAHALRGGDGVADFAFAGYSSGLTGFAAQQSAANGQLILAATAASPSAFQNGGNISFGTLPPAYSYLDSSWQAIRAAAANFSHWAAQSSATYDSSAQLKVWGTKRIRAGFIQANAVFTKSTCENVPQTMKAAGMSISTAGMQTVSKSPEVDDVMQALTRLQDDGVNVLFGCTYYDTGMAVINALERLDYAPFAIVLTSTVTTPGYADLVAKGWWQGEYFLGPTPWHEGMPVRGGFSKMTSSEFAERYRNRHTSEASYHGASQFASCCALSAAIESADSLNTTKVVAALRGLRLSEFFGLVGFNANGQNNLIDMLGVQYAPGSASAAVVFPTSAVTSGKLEYPMPSWAQRRCRVLGPGKTWKDSIKVSKDKLARECSGNGFCNEQGLCVCGDGWDGDSCSHHTTVEETGLPAWGTALIVVGVVLVGVCLFYALCRYKNRHIHRQKSIIEDIQKELQDLKDSVVGMRSVVSNFMPTVDSDGVICVASPSGACAHAPKERALWYWAEDVDRMSSHNSSMTLAPHWVQYAGSVAMELEDQYTLYIAGSAPATYQTDLQDRISTTGTEVKAFGALTGTKYSINFEDLKQVNAKSGFKRDILRQLVTEGELSTVRAASITSVSSSSTLASEIPGELLLSREVILALKAGSIVQLSQQRPDGWAFGNVIFEPDTMDTRPPLSTENISFDAGWFPLSCTTLPTKEALSQLSNMMGSAGADCLAPPSTWGELKDPLVAQLVQLSDGPEKYAAVDWFMKTLTPAINVVKVERIQNLSLWQSFAVKRQTMLSREGKAGSSDISRLERVWLFHGAPADIAPKIMQQGFNRSFCGRNATMYGKGVYFARDASYSSSRAYAQPDASGVQRMFLCRVAVGEYCQGKKDALTPDVRDAGGHILYDTTVDNSRDPSIYVTYHDAQAYPEYLVHFKQ